MRGQRAVPCRSARGSRFGNRMWLRGTGFLITWGGPLWGLTAKIIWKPCLRSPSLQKRHLGHSVTTHGVEGDRRGSPTQLPWAPLPPAASHLLASLHHVFSTWNASLSSPWAVHTNPSPEWPPLLRKEVLLDSRWAGEGCEGASPP